MSKTKAAERPATNGFDLGALLDELSRPLNGGGGDLDGVSSTFSLENEASRVYLFNNGGDDHEVEIVNPVTLYERANGEHLITDADGGGYVVSPGWFLIEITPKSGQPAFTF